MKYKLSNSKVLNLLGLILITIGSLILAINTGKTLTVNTVLMEHIQKSYGLASMGPMSDIERDNFIKVVKSAKTKNLFGYSLFIVGFGLQAVIATLKLKKE